MLSDPIERARRGAGFGIAFVVTGPSGAGKTSVIERAMEQLEGLAFCVSHTTRPIRDCETDGEDYVFVSQERFQELVDADAFVEYTEFSSARYGTSIEQLKRAFGEKNDVILNVEVQGAENIRKKGLGENPVVMVFLVPSSMDRLAERLRARGTDNEAKIAERISVAESEVACLRDFHYLVINDDLDRAVDELCAIIEAERLRIPTT